MKIRSTKLTTCRVATDGGEIGLDFIDQSGAPVTVELPFEQAEAVVMTLPRLLAGAVRQLSGDDSARYVFSLQGWTIESVKERDCLITTLTTTDGFEVCFGMPLEASRSLGWNLLHSTDEAAEAVALEPAGSAGKFN